MSIRLPRLLDGAGRERCRLHPIRLSLKLRLAPLSTAEMTLPASEAAVAVRDLVELYDEQGSVGVFRVTSIEEDVGLTRHLHLEHGLATLSDHLAAAYAGEAPLRELLEHLLACQTAPLWQLGDIGLPEGLTLGYNTGNANLLTALMSLLALLPQDVALFCDQSQLPWTLHLRPFTDEDVCEGRMQRSLSGLRIETDASSLCTRVYPYGAGQGSSRIGIEGVAGQPYLDSAAAGTWGIISRTFVAGTVYDAELLKSVAEKYLERHSVPTVSVTAEAIDLAALTGEPLDSFRLGRLCRLALPDKGLTLNERIVCLDKPDVFGHPGQVTLTLCNRVEDASDEIASILREVISSQTQGGLVRTITTARHANGTSTDPVAHIFHVEDGLTVLSCKAMIDPGGDVGILYLYVDGSRFPGDVLPEVDYDVLPYLRRNASGTITTGQHYLTIYPKREIGVDSTVVLRVIDAL